MGLDNLIEQDEKSRVSILFGLFSVVTYTEGIRGQRHYTHFTSYRVLGIPLLKLKRGIRYV